MKCNMCEKEVKEICRDFICKDCHVSLSWEECNTGTFNARYLLKNGYDRDLLKKLYPNADI